MSEINGKRLTSLTNTEWSERRYQYAQDHYGKVVVDKVGLRVEDQQEVLETAIDAMDAITRVIEFTKNLREEAGDGPMSGVAKAFADEIERALKARS